MPGLGDVDFALTPEQELIRTTVRTFAEQEVQPRAKALDAEDAFPRDLWQRLIELQLTGVIIPERYGGAGLDMVSYMLTIEEISRVCAGLAVALSVHISVATSPILLFGTDQQRERFVVPMAKGALLGGFAQTEPNAGSDAAGITTTASRREGGWVLNGTKTFITNGDGDVFVTTAKTDPAAGHKGMTTFIVTKELDGFSLGVKEDKMGIRASTTYELLFTDMFVPDDQVLGLPGEGFRIAMATLDASRIGIGAQAIGIAQGAFDQALAYAQQRQAFGGPIGRFGAIQQMLADMAVRLESARLLVYQAAWRKDRGLDVNKQASMAKLFASETATFVTNKAVQIHGGYGYIKEYDVERYYRDAKVTELYEGTSEIQRLVIARQLLKE